MKRKIKRVLASALALLMLAAPLPPARAELVEGPDVIDYSKYRTEQFITKEELTLGGKPFYELTIEEAAALRPGKEVFVSQQGDSVYKYEDTVDILQRKGSLRLNYVHYWYSDWYGDASVTLQAELRDIAIGDGLQTVLSKIGIANAGAAEIATAMANANPQKTAVLNFSGNQLKMDPSTHYYTINDKLIEQAIEGRLDDVLVRMEFIDDRLISLGYYNTPDIQVSESTTLPGGVKYTPYSATLPGAGTLDGVLPSGLALDPATGEISGVPQASGTFTFRVTLADNSALDCTLVIQENADTTVQTPNAYPITEPVGQADAQGAFVKNSYDDETLVIDGPFAEFDALYLDGGKLARGTDYDAAEGSTKLTIRAQTFQKRGAGKHTIAAAFREGGQPKGKLKTVAQNYTIPQSVPNPGKTQTAALPFVDISSRDWFYPDALWSYQQNLVKGVDGTHFAPKSSISQAVIVTILARVAKIDLTQFAGAQEAGIGEGYFKEAAIWARRSGLLPKGTAFTGKEATTREGMAILLSQYLASMGEDVSAPANPVTFADAGAMSAQGKAAFQLLYQKGIFKGTGDLRMDPKGTTTRAQFVALVYRINSMLEN